MKRGNFAFFCEKPSAIPVIRKLFDPHEVCDTREIVFRRNVPSAFLLKRFSPLRERFLISWLRMAEHGIVQKILLAWNDAWPTCYYRNHFESVRFEYAAPVLLFLVSAYVISICILAVEWCQKKAMASKKLRFPKTQE